jgi:hypothetical protein
MGGTTLHATILIASAPAAVLRTFQQIEGWPHWYPGVLRARWVAGTPWQPDAVMAIQVKNSLAMTVASTARLDHPLSGLGGVDARGVLLYPAKVLSRCGGAVNHVAKSASTAAIARRVSQLAPTARSSLSFCTMSIISPSRIVAGLPILTPFAPCHQSKSSSPLFYLGDNCNAGKWCRLLL